jgi:PEP-CTERM motif
MMRNFLLGLSALVALGASPASATVLTFDGDICDGIDNACSNFSRIQDTYGDISGVIDVQYDRLVGNPDEGTLSWWDQDYNDLQGVAWGAFGDSEGVSEIFLNPLNGQAVRLLGFDLGAYSNTSLESQFTILSGAGTVLFSSGAITVGQLPANVHNSYSFNIASADGIRIQWGPSSYNVGIDNIEYEMGGAGGIPEPATWALMIGGFGAAGTMLRRRRALAA